MRGLVISSNSRRPNPVPKGQHPFAFYFQPILPALAHFYWVSEQSPVQYVQEAEDTRWIGDLVKFEATDDYVLFEPGGLLPRYAAYVKEDWNTLYGFLQKPDPVPFIKELDRLWLRDGKNYSSFIKGGGVFDEPGYQKFIQQQGSDSGRYLAATIDLFCCNVDGAWWEVYARDENLVESVRSHLKDVTGLRVTEQLLEKRRD